eukprot:5387802-Ditylum_brightwellii.AAC.1
MIKLNNDLDKFPMLKGVTTTKLSQKESVDALENRVLLQWKLEFEKKGFAYTQKKWRYTS